MFLFNRPEDLTFRDSRLASSFDDRAGSGPFEFRRLSSELQHILLAFAGVEVKHASILFDIKESSFPLEFNTAE
jgi:hypothetical protein